ncbi:MAG: Phosphoglycerate kinase [Parcubacteria group bacterium GW2011_GWF2_45_11]|nr:MAG: Phosphoglycerate kinase [Parcubacteria group bacterium GW2011_GWF2_45_11]
MKIRSIQQIKNLKGKNVLLRVDCNVPLDGRGRIVDDYRIQSILPTIRHLIIKGANVILINHLGRPDGKIVPALSNKIVARHLSRLLEKKVTVFEDITSQENIKKARGLGYRQIAMLENIRFRPAEEKNNLAFAAKLAQYGDLYINDAFAVSHRSHASVAAITRYLPAYAGLLLEKEIENLSRVFESKARPKLAIIGGFKLETKVPVISNLLKNMDYVLTGGAVANGILKAMGYEIGLSRIDGHKPELAKKIQSDKLIVPFDVVVAKNMKAQAKTEVKAVGQVGPKDIILDIGPKTVKFYSFFIKEAQLVIWNGPLGYFEVDRYKEASREIARAAVSYPVNSIIGGGETVQLATELGLVKRFDFVSTGGGAMLEFLEGKILPGIKPLLLKK